LRCLHRATVGVALKAELYSLAGLNVGIPAEVARAVVTAEAGVPQAGNSVTGIGPVHLPAVNCGRATVGNADGSSKTRAPGVGYVIATCCLRRRYPGGGE